MAKKKVQVSAQADFRFAPTSGANLEKYSASRRRSYLAYSHLSSVAELHGNDEGCSATPTRSAVF